LFVAIIFDSIVCPRIRLYGAAYSTDKGTVHSFASLIEAFAPLQFVNASENPPSACLMRIVYAVIGVPFSEGFFQEMMTLFATTTDVGGAGLEGIVAQRIDTP
jgi:hypothetical protein